MLLLRYTRFLNENIEIVATYIRGEKEKEGVRGREQRGNEEKIV